MKDFSGLDRKGARYAEQGPGGAEEDPADSLYDLQLLREGLPDEYRYLRDLYGDEHADPTGTSAAAAHQEMAGKRPRKEARIRVRHAAPVRRPARSISRSG